MTPDEKVGHVDSAYTAAPKVVTAKMLKQLNETQIGDDALYRTWCHELHVDVDPLESSEGQETAAEGH